MLGFGPENLFIREEVIAAKFGGILERSPSFLRPMASHFGIAAESVTAGGGAARGTPWEMLNVEPQTTMVQSGLNTCGPACGANMANGLGFADVTESSLIQALGSGNTSSGSLSGALRNSTGMDFGGGAVQWNPAGMSTTKVQQFVGGLSAQGKQPFMALFNAPGSAAADGHWVLVKGLNDAGLVKIADPAGFTYTQTATGFKTAWRSGEIVYPKP